MLDQVDNLVIRAGETFSRTYPLTDGFVTTGSPTATLKVRASRDASDTALALASGSGITFDLVALTVTFTMSPSQTLALMTSLAAHRRGRWDLETVDGVGIQNFPAGGDLDIVQAQATR